MTTIARRTFLVAVAVVPISRVAFAVDALPDARFVGFAETVNDFEIQSGQLALTKSSSEPIRAYATRAIAEHTAIATVGVAALTEAVGRRHAHRPQVVGPPRTARPRGRPGRGGKGVTPCAAPTLANSSRRS